MDFATSSASTASFSTGAAVQIQRQQAQQAARQAELRADSLQREASNARKEADATEQRADSLQQQASAAGDEARLVRQGLRTGEGFNQMGERLEATATRLADAVSSANAASGPLRPGPRSTATAS